MSGSRQSTESLCNDGVVIEMLQTTTNPTRHANQIRSFAMKQWEAGALPTPHLLDGTWWFDDETVDFFQHLIENTDGLTACLGTPSVFLRASRDLPSKVILIDKDPLLRQVLLRHGHQNVITADLQRICPLNLEADLVIADPPWYENEMNSFLDAAHAAAKVGATILMSIPPRETRSTIEEERLRIFERATEAGLILRGVACGGTRYICPPFEHNVLRSMGEEFIRDWRVGDLAKFEVIQPKLVCQEPVLEIGEWDEICLARTRLRLARRPTLERGQTQLLSMGWPEDVFPSCSRRHPLRGCADVWTSGNRAFTCRDTSGLLRLALHLQSDSLDKLGRKVADLPASFSQEDQQSAHQLLRLAQREEQEYEAVRQLYV